MMLRMDESVFAAGKRNDRGSRRTLSVWQASWEVVRQTPAAHGSRGRGRNLRRFMKQPAASCLPVRCHRIRPLDDRPGAPRTRRLRVGRRRRPRASRCQLKPRRRPQGRVKPAFQTPGLQRAQRFRRMPQFSAPPSAIAPMAQFSILISPTIRADMCDLVSGLHRRAFQSLARVPQVTASLVATSRVRLVPYETMRDSSC
jgi:hypothetical protein